MLFRKEGDYIIGYILVPAKEEIVRKFTIAEFDEMKKELADKVKLDPKTIGDAVIADNQATLDKLKAVKLEGE
jgi:hypothetical protein